MGKPLAQMIMGCVTAEDVIKTIVRDAAHYSESSAYALDLDRAGLKWFMIDALWERGWVAPDAGRTLRLTAKGFAAACRMLS